MHDETHKVLRVNRSLAEFIGVRPAELIGVGMRALLEGLVQAAPGLVEQPPPLTSFLWRSARMLGVAIGINAARTPI